MSRFFGNPVHAAFVVPDLDSTINRMLASGIGPAFHLRRLQLPGRYRGLRHDAVFAASFITSGSMQYEIIQQHDNTPSAYLEFLERNPQGGLHHLAYYSDNFDADIQRARAAGIEFRIVQEFLTQDGPPFEIYMEPVNSPDPLLVQFMYRGPTETVFTEMGKITAAWDGRDAVRNLFDLMPLELRLPVAAD